MIEPAASPSPCEHGIPDLVVCPQCDPVTHEAVRQQLVRPDPVPTTARPARIQRSRAKGWRMPEGAIYVGRPTRWGNPGSRHRTGLDFAHSFVAEQDLAGCHGA